MNPGELRNRIEIQNYIGVENEVGEETKQWQTYVKVWAKFKDPSIKRELSTAADKKVSSVSHKIVIRYRNDIDTTMRVAYKGKSYNIDHVVNDKEQNVESHIYCTFIEEGPQDE